MEGNGCVQRLDLAEIFTMSVFKLKNDVKIANLFIQAWSTCLPRPGLPVYPGLVYLFTQAWIFFKIWRHPRKHSFCMDFVIYGVPRARDYYHEIRLDKLL